MFTERGAGGGFVPRRILGSPFWLGGRTKQSETVECLELRFVEN
jgi:hypothetical protein